MRNSEKSEILRDAQKVDFPESGENVRRTKGARPEGSEKGGEYKPLTETERLRCVIRILENDVKEARRESVKKFAHFLIDHARKGVINTSDLPDYVCEFWVKGEEKV